MTDNLELRYAAARLTGYLLGMLRVGEVPAHLQGSLSELVESVRRANGMEETSAKPEAV